MELLSQFEYIRFIQKKEGEREMTKKEKEVFRTYKEMVTEDMFDSMENGDEKSLLVAREKFSLLQKLDRSLKEIEQGA